MKTKRIMTILMVLGMLIVLPGGKVKAQRIPLYRYVVPGGSTTSANCQGNDPCDLRYAIDVVAQPHDILIVHSGTYTSTLPSEDLIFIDKSLTLWGSCEFDASTPFICYPDAQNSILDGENAKRVVRIDGVLGTEEVVIKGFTIMRGSGTGMAPCYFGSGCGAGVYAKDLWRLNLEQNYIWDNTGGYTNGVGGGLYAENVDLVEVEDNIFIFNQATDSGIGGGGAAFVYGSGGPHAVIFEHNVFSGNETSSVDTPTHAGGALCIINSNNAQINYNSFEYQNAIRQNLNILGTSIYFDTISGFSIEGNSFANDWGTSVVSINGNSSTGSSIKRNKWWNNSVFTNIELDGDFSVDITNNFLGRQILGTLSRGGSSTLINIEGNSATERVSADIFFNTFAAANYGVDVGDYADVHLSANIFTELTEGILLSGTTSTHTISDNLFYNNVTYNTLGSPYYYEDPLLVNVANGDFHLMPNSGAIDKVTAVDFDIDIDGGHRPIGPGATPYDLGADEFAWLTHLPFMMK